MKDVGAPRSNRRLASRLACQLTVRYRAGKEWHPATAMDLSGSGCRLRLGEDLPRGTGVRVSVETPGTDGSPVVSAEAPGTVIWSRLEGLSHQAGIQFTFAGEPQGLADLLAAIR